MFWFRKKGGPVWECSTAINISKHPFYEWERPATSKHRMLCVAPDDGSDVEWFGDFMRLCVERLLSNYSDVLEVAKDVSVSHELRREPFITDFLSSAGQVLLPQEEVLIARSGWQKPRLISLIPYPDLSCYGYDIFAFSQPVPAECLLDTTFDFRASDFVLHLSCSEWHDYFLMESTQNLEPFIDMIRSVCQEQGRELIVEL